MVKRMSPFSMKKHNQVCVKFAASFILAGLTFRLLLWNSLSFSSVVMETPPPLAGEKTESPVLDLPLQDSDSTDFQRSNNQSQTFHNGN
ncbi:hypothetical protein RIF29_16452 [Crotalaria pallida]|uniref:Uncharacterized protein n=1 Tax=Crotalaria pallida TaxID=3830 RepID=A0AAN9FF87_CROPI